MRTSLVIAVAALLATAGCMGVGLNSASYDAPPAEVSNNVAEENMYNLSAVNQFEFNRTVNITENREYQINASNWVSVYQKQAAYNTTVQSQEISTQALSMFAVVSTPSVEVAGTELNPLVNAPMSEILTRVTSQNENIEVNEKIGESTIVHQSTGQNVTVEKYNATIQLSEEGVTTDAYIQSAVINTEDAVLVTVGVYPVQLDEEAAIHSMIGNVTTTDEPPVVESSNTEENSAAEEQTTVN